MSEVLPNPELLIVGAGPVGSVIAERAAALMDWKSVIVEKRKHVAGNCYDRKHESGVLIHQYGPHYFRTNDRNLLEYLTRFSDWIAGNYVVKVFHNGRYYPFPINLTTLELFFGRKLDEKAAAELLESVRMPIEAPQNSEEFVLSRVGRELYEAFYLGYTLKQWDRHPKDLAASVCGRIPVRLNRDEQYVDHAFKVTPKEGFTRLFGNMVQHPNIQVVLGEEFKEMRKRVQPSIATIYTGAIDEYFDFSLGKLPWRSLEFDFVPYEQEYRQPCVQINYPNEHAYTRTVEIKHVTGQKCPNTVISYEYPKAQGEPYYPIPAPEGKRLYERYKELADLETQARSVYFCGRLAEYTYINTDEAIERGLRMFERVVRESLKRGMHGRSLDRDAHLQ